ncbi:MAG: hypothetical protein RL194_531 [Pseudomonadota bacterium]
MAWLESFHIIFMVTWFAGLFYLPRLYVYHAMCDINDPADASSIARFKVMERKLFWGIMTPGAIITIALGITLWLTYGFSGGWLLTKQALVAGLVIYHIYCGKLLVDFKHDRNKHSHVYYRWFNEIPVVALIAIVLLVVFKPY